MTFYLQGYQKYDRSMLKVLLLWSEFRRFNSDLSYFWYISRCRVIQYIIEKLSDTDMVKMRWSCGSTLNVCQDVLKSVHFLNKFCFVYFQSSSIVQIDYFKKVVVRLWGHPLITSEFLRWFWTPPPPLSEFYLLSHIY